MIKEISDNPSGVSRALNLILLDQSYLGGWTPCQLDWEVHKHLPTPGSNHPNLHKHLPTPGSNHPNLQRWHHHIRSFTQAEVQQFNKSEMTLKQLLINKKVYSILNPKKVKTPKINPGAREASTGNVKKRKGGKNDVPDRWEAYCKIGSVVEGTPFIPFKVPLKQCILDKVSKEVDNKWRVEDVISAVPGLGLVIDLTFTTRYYDPKIFTSNDIKHKKILTAGHGVPEEQVVEEFVKAVDSLVAEGGEKLVGVHCTHGLNRTGYLVCRYMIQRLGIEPEVAMAAFDRARGHKMERVNYIEHLKAKSWEHVNK